MFNVTVSEEVRNELEAKGINVDQEIEQGIMAGFNQSYVRLNVEVDNIKVETDPMTFIPKLTAKIGINLEPLQDLQSIDSELLYYMIGKQLIVNLQKPRKG